MLSHLRDGKSVDLPRGDQPFDRNRPFTNWLVMPNPRWRVFFHRLSSDEHAAHRQAVADYLLRTAISRRDGAQRVVSLDLVYVERTAEPASSSANYLARTTATSRSGDPPPEDSLRKALDAFDRWLFGP